MLHIISSRTMLHAGAAVAALAATPSLAQVDEPPVQQQSDDAAADAAGEGQEIVVTARRREESLLDVPIAITAYAGAQLEAAGAIDITDISNTTPNVTLENSRATNSTLTAFIRGVGQQDPVSGFEQGVGIYLDDVYLNRPQAAVLDIYDVERIEVLRGPQGTLYGRNTIGGAIKYVTRRLGDEPTLRIRGTYGEYNQADLVVSGSAPIGDGTVKVGGAVAKLTRDGFGDNLTTGEDNYDKNVWAARGTLQIEPSDQAFFRLTGDYTHDQSSPRNGHRLIPGLASGTPVLDDVYDTQGGLNSPEQDVEASGVSLFGEIKPTDRLTFRSITGYRKDDSATPIDFDALPAVDLDVPGFYKNHQFSQELQVLFNAGGFNGLVGGYFLDADALTQFDVRLFTTVPGLTAFTDADVHTEAFAIFGDFTYDFGRLSVSAGGRYTWDRREADILRQNYLGGGSPVFGGAGVPLGPPATNFHGERQFNKFTPRASVSFKPTTDQTIYASFSQGFKGGGFDPRGVGANAPDLNSDGVRDQNEVAAFLSFRPETVDSYEIGYKAALFDRRLTLALAAFRADYTDVQIPGSAGCTVNGLPTFCGVVTNAGKARFQGVEAEANARVARDLAAAGDALTLAATLGYIDADYKEYITNIPGQGPVDVAPFRQVQNTPKWTASGTLGYTTPIGSGSLDLNSTLSYRSKTYQFEIPNPFLDQAGYALLDASIVYHGADDRWSIGVHGKNLLDKQYKTSGYTFVATDPVTGALLQDPTTGNLIPVLGKEGTLTAFYGNPRQVFATVTVKF